MNVILAGADTRAPTYSLARYRSVRARTDALAAPLSSEDQTVQSMPDASPTKWHRAHTTWFFETFLLKPFLPEYRSLREEYAFLFNSYYEAAGPRHARPRRGMVTRPSSAEVAEYRSAVDEGSDCSAETRQTIDAEVSRIIGEQAARAESLLTAHRDALTLLATRLLEVESLDGSDVREVLARPATSPDQQVASVGSAHS